MPGSVVYIVSGALCLGVAVGLLYPLDIFICFVVLGVSVLMVGVGVLSRKPLFFLLAIVLVSVLLGVLRSRQVLHAENAETLQTYIGHAAEVEGKVVDDPDRRDTSLHVTVQVAKINNAPATGELLVLMSREEQVSYGSAVVVKGKIEAPKAFLIDTGHTFDYPDYLRAHGVSAIVPRATLVKVERGGWSVLGPLFALKHAFEKSLEQQFVEPDGSLMEGILLGEKHGIPKSMTKTFVQSGLVHVVVLSGYNIAVVSEAMFRALSFLPRTLGLGAGGVLMILFALMTGAGSATLRALFMALIGLLARYMHRSAVALRSLCVGAAAMALWNPLALLYDTSFILSVLATFGLITLSPWVEQKLPKWAKKREWIRSTAASTIAVQIFTLPALLYFSGVLSLVSVPANVLGLEVVPLAMLLGFVAGLLGLVSPLLGFVPAFAADLLLKWMILVANTAASIPLGSIVISEFSPWFLVAIYIPLTWFAVRRYQKYKVSI